MGASYQSRGVSADEPGLHGAEAGRGAGLPPGAFGRVACDP